VGGCEAVKMEDLANASKMLKGGWCKQVGGSKCRKSCTFGLGTAWLGVQVVFGAHGYGDGAGPWGRGSGRGVWKQGCEQMADGGHGGWGMVVGMSARWE
jgi:hypothetical protein